jgi:hypothetical protein
VVAASAGFLVRCTGPKWSARSTDDRSGLADDDLAVQWVDVQGRPKRSNNRRLRPGGVACGIVRWGRPRRPFGGLAAWQHRQVYPRTPRDIAPSSSHAVSSRVQLAPAAPFN